MMIIMKSSATPQEVEHVIEHIKAFCPSFARSRNDDYWRYRRDS